MTRHTSQKKFAPAARMLRVVVASAFQQTFISRLDFIKFILLKIYPVKILIR